MSELSKLVLTVEILVQFRHKNAEGYESITWLYCKFQLLVLLFWFTLSALMMWFSEKRQ